MLFCYFCCLSLIDCDCGYYAENGVAIPLNECQHYIGYDVSFKYECTGNTLNGSDIVQFIRYTGTDKCSSNEAEDIIIMDKYCNNNGITCNCNGNGDDCSTLLWIFEDYIEFENNKKHECNHESYSEWTYIVNTCIPDNNGGSTQLSCFEDDKSDIDQFKLIQYHTNNCNEGGIDITNNILTNCTTVICNAHLNANQDDEEIDTSEDNKTGEGMSKLIINVITCIMIICLFL